MKAVQNRYAKKHGSRAFLFTAIALLFIQLSYAQITKPRLQYTVSLLHPERHVIQVALQVSGWNKDTLELKMPKWMPGYYQLMNYAGAVTDVAALDQNNKLLTVIQPNGNTWRIIGIKGTAITLRYAVKATTAFVANPYLDSTHAYLVPSGLFMYVNGQLNLPVHVRIQAPKDWPDIATGLEPVAGKPADFSAPDFDVLYDCPLLVGRLKTLPSFQVRGIEHRFIGYGLANFNEALFMQQLKKVVETAVAIIGDIPYKRYTFIGIGPGRGGIEHLNNTTVSFTGQGLQTEAEVNRVMNFLAHEYFHHYNVKRIRPFELGPFDYDKENRTNLLWVSEGLSVYYEYLIVKRAGLTDEAVLLRNFENNINALENNPGREHQSLAQAGYETWSDGPFGTQGKEAGKSISYYEKGPVVGLILDFAIRHATANRQCLDDVMRLLYRRYYQQLKRGFTDAEMQEACETVAGVSLRDVFDYVYTTKELDYNRYLSYAGLFMKIDKDAATGRKHYTLQRLANAGSEQQALLNSWLGR